jgi:hypothetical protein
MDKNKEEGRFQDWDNKRVYSEQVETRESLDKLQDKYFDLLKNLTDGDSLMFKDSIDYETLKERQIDIIGKTMFLRDISLEASKRALETAFTPHIKSMLSKKIQDEMKLDEVDTETDEEE